MTEPFSWMPSFNADAQGDAREAFENNEEAIRAAAQAQRETARLFFDVFNVGRGPELLDLLRSQTIDVDLMNLTGVIGSETREIPVSPEQWAFHRNGQNSVVRYIESMIRTAMVAEAEENQNV